MSIRSNKYFLNFYIRKKKEIYFDKLHSILKPNGGKGLIQLCKEFKVCNIKITNLILDDRL